MTQQLETLEVGLSRRHFYTVASLSVLIGVSIAVGLVWTVLYFKDGSPSLLQGLGTALVGFVLLGFYSLGLKRLDTNSDIQQPIPDSKATSESPPKTDVPPTKA